MNHVRTSHRWHRLTVLGLDIRRLSCVVLGIGMLMPRVLSAQGFSPAEAAARMTAPRGMEVTLYASEPTVRQPVTLEFDDRGRLWTIQYLQYPNPAGLVRVKVDRYSRTTYDRIPDPPPRGTRGADRISILSDQDGDGLAETTRDFVDGLNLATGLAFGNGGVYVLNVPFLLFYPDRNQDDRPDSDPEVLLTGFGMEDAHSVANSLCWGPDGWLYGCQGSTVTANIRGIEFQQGVWRYHPATRRFELYCEGGGNSWGLDFDAHGNLFYSTNHGGYCMLHGVRGGYYWKNFGKHGALHNAHAYGFFEHVPHSNFHGGHVTAGGLVYQGTSFPAEFRGTYLGADLLGHGVYWHHIEPRGTSFQNRFGGELLVGNDTWFAPCDLCVGPDGAVYVADWHDQRTAHPDPDAEWDRRNGRIYRIQADRAPAVEVPDWSKQSDQDLVGLLNDSNEWIARRARRHLHERETCVASREVLERTVLNDTEPRAALRALWALMDQPAPPDLAAKLLAAADPDVRRWAVRWLGERDELPASLEPHLIALAKSESEASVRQELALQARGWPRQLGLPILLALIERDLDGDDPYSPLILWWGLERHALEGRDEIVSGTIAARQSHLARDFILPRLMRRYAAEGTEAGLSAALTLWDEFASDDPRMELPAAFETGLTEIPAALAGGAGDLLTGFAAQTPVGSASVAEGKPDREALLQSEAANQWRQRLDRLSDISLSAMRAGAWFKGDRALGQARALIFDRGKTDDARITALQIVGRHAPVQSVRQLLPVASDNNNSPQVQAAALRSLAGLADPELGPRILEQYAAWPAEVRGTAREVLLSRRPWALALLRAIDEGQLAADEVPLDQVRLVALFDDAEANRLVLKHWGTVQGGTPEEKLAEVRRFQNDLRPGGGNPAAGGILFEKHCGTCHRLHGQGQQVGPDLTTANRRDRDYLLITLVDPSVVIRKEFLSYVATLRDGRVLTGLIAEQTPATVTLLTGKNERVVVPVGDLEELAESPLSLMPDKLLNPLSLAELRDLFSYLESDAPPPVP